MLNMKNERDRALDMYWSDYERKIDNEEKSDNAYKTILNRSLINEKKLESMIQKEEESEDKKSKSGVTLVGTTMTTPVLGEFVDVIG